MTAILIAPLTVFLSCVLTAAFAVAPGNSNRTPAERFLLGLGLSLLGLFGLGFALYATQLPRTWVWIWPTVVLGLGWGRQQKIMELARDPQVRALLVGWAVFAAWGVCLLLCVEVYGGGWWVGDWLEHYERAQFWRTGGEPSRTFLYGSYSLGARPPLANLVASVLLELSHTNFAGYLVLNLLAGSLVWFPAALLAQTLAEPTKTPAARTFALALLLLTPFVAQNLVFGWTRQFTNFGVLAGIFWLLKGLRAPAASVADRRAGFLFLAGAFLAHYSAGPYIVTAVGAYLWCFRRALTSARFRRETLGHAALCGSLITLWLGWAILQLGPHGAWGETTTALQAEGKSPRENLQTFALNLRDTLVPHSFREIPPPYPAIPPQASAAGKLRDFFFHLYQVNLPFLFGFGGLSALLLALTRPGALRAGPFALVLTTVLLGVGVHTARDHLGLAHICLQPLTLTGLAWLAARLPETDACAARRIWAAGAILDFALGVALHFALQSHRFGPPGHYSETIHRNLQLLAEQNLAMPRALLTPPDWLLAAVACATPALALILALRAANDRSAPPDPPPSAPPAPPTLNAT